ncbi:MAG TPA: hypothetical protein VHU40_19535, partial [Polyangia bacterium]|nr:hypothetical protein [Polyangia bacterium]
MNSRPSPARRCALALAALSGSLAGCSFIFSQAPPLDHESRDHFSCSGVVPPVLDTVWATLNFVGAAYAGSTDQRTWDQSSHLAGRQASLLGGVASGLLYGASSIYGYVVAADCSAAEEALLRRGGTV